MKPEKLDRVLVMVRDLDRFMTYFRDVVGVELVEVNDPVADAMGVRCAMNMDYQMEVMSPVCVPESAPDYVKRFARRLKTEDAFVAGLGFRVGSLSDAARELQTKGLRLASEYQLDVFGPMRNLQEAIVAEEDAFGLSLAFVRYDRLGSDDGSPE